MPVSFNGNGITRLRGDEFIQIQVLAFFFFFFVRYFVRKNLIYRQQLFVSPVIGLVRWNPIIGCPGQ